MGRTHALGLLVKNRWNLTQKTLQSLYHTDQLKDSYDLFIIDNGSDPVLSSNLSEWAKTAIIPVKNLIRTKAIKTNTTPIIIISGCKSLSLKSSIQKRQPLDLVEWVVISPEFV